MIATALQSARSPDEVLRVTEELFRDGDANLAALQRLGVPRNSRLLDMDDLEDCIARMRNALDRTPMTDRDEAEAVRMLGYLMVASLRAQQLS